MTTLSLENISNRIRYESVSKLADAIGRADTLDDIRKALQKNVKFIVSSYAYFFCFHTEGQAITFEFNANISLSSNELLLQLDKLDERPFIFKSDTNDVADEIVNLFFQIEKNKAVARVCSKSQNSCIAAYCSTKDEIGFNITDIKFIKLICEIVSPKVQSILLNKRISQQNVDLKEANLSIAEANKELSSSIDYATMIQSALLPSEESINKHFNKSFVFFQPRDKVSGDFYYSFEQNGYKMIIAADCTGHGVPGAILSIFGIQILREVSALVENLRPDLILNLLDAKFKSYLKHDSSEIKISLQDGMDIAVVTVCEKTKLVWFSSASRPLNYFRKNGEQLNIKGSRFPIGNSYYHKIKLFELHELRYEEGDRFYIYSDGYPDQFGGERNKKFGSKRLLATLSEIQKKPFEKHRDILANEFKEWKGDEEQIDDVLIMGVEL